MNKIEGFVSEIRHKVNRLLHYFLFPIHVVVVSLVYLIWLARRKDFVISAVPLYSFGPLVRETPYRLKFQAKKYKESGKRLVVFLNPSRFLKENQWKLARIDKSTTPNLVMIRWKVITCIYNYYRPGHCEDPIYKTLSRIERLGYMPISMQGIVATKVLGAESRNGHLLTQQQIGSTSTFFINRNEESRSQRIALDNGFDPKIHRGIVALVARDSFYRRLQHSAFRRVEKHARDMDFSVYVKSIQYLVDEGYFVIRMGSVQEPFPYVFESFWDYGGAPMHDEAFDFYVARSCLFCVSTGSGWDNAPLIFGKPVGLVGYYGDIYSWPMGYGRPCRVILPKVVESMADNRTLNYSEIYGSLRVHLSLERRESEFRVQDPRPEDVLEAVKLIKAESERPSDFHDLRLKQYADMSNSLHVLDKELSLPWKPEEHPLVPPTYYSANKQWILR